MTTEYLDKTGLSYFWGKIKSYISQHGGVTILDCYPVGSVYWTSDGTFNPNTAWGGTWTQITDTFVLAAGSTYTAGATGGAATFSYTPAGTNADTTLTDKQMAHGHTYTSPTVSSSGKVTAGITGGSHHHAVGWSSVNRGSGSTGTRQVSTVSGTNTNNTSDTTHTHDLPNHSHTLTGGGVADLHGASSTREGHSHTFSGTAATIATMPPYVVRYCWERTA